MVSYLKRLHLELVTRLSWYSIASSIIFCEYDNEHLNSLRAMILFYV
jgi:hypothetical protein